MTTTRESELTFRLRTEPRPGDRDAVEDIVRSTGYFSPSEVAVAVELIDDRLTKGTASDYHFVFCDLDDRTVGYSCYGLIACTVHSFDVYWIAVHSDLQRRALGRRLMDVTEQHIARQHGRRIYVETSGREQYVSTRLFYERCGYEVEAVFRDFYDLGDDKVVYLKVVEPEMAAS